ncbi:IS110 family transposase [Rhodocista pekingensis]|uniref:IS110 family transposase n=1 Tax=Rhodocista pekingensis TaxID=201185 RepID=A0ABW2L0J4_9PROT
MLAHGTPSDRTIFVALELSRSSWLVAVSAPGWIKVSKHRVEAGDGAGLIALLAKVKEDAERRVGTGLAVVTIQEAGLDGFWLHRLLVANGVDSHVVHAASLQVDRRQRRAKTDAIDAEGLLRALMAHARGERRVCSMVPPPTPEDEDLRRVARERENLMKERIRHTNRVKVLLGGQGIIDYEPMRADRKVRLVALCTGDGRPLPPWLAAEIGRELDRLELVLSQLSSVEAERDRLLLAAREAEEASPADPVPLLMRLKGIGPEFATALGLEAFFRHFGNRREVAAYAGLAPSPWKSGGIDREQGISKAGNPRLRRTMVELAWMWLRHQPDTAASRWFRERAGRAGGRVRRIAIVAMARKLLVALWRYVSEGVVPEGAVLKA